MQIRHAAHPEDAKQYTTDRLRRDFLIEDLFQTNQVSMVYSHYDRMVIGGAVPTEEGLALEAADTLKTGFFLERREIGVVNIGPAGYVTVDGEAFHLNKMDCLYIGLGKQDVKFHSQDPSNPTRFYFVSCPAHKEYPTQLQGIDQAEPNRLGSDDKSNRRTIYKYIHADGIKSCQLMLGITVLEPNNMWNTMPAHIHDRRMEVYLYFDLAENDRVMHFMGQPHETRHLVVKNEQSVISPSWSIHSGVGTSNYTFIWAMAGENYTFTDMDAVAMDDLR
ncbi:5-dehydro-4-deoxy-D-glucuronate isomerase [Brevibacillus dissolubilis]|uniref:5-dehydro-4-deoxy-D-glucuronate isomerase n=1 Tax=Brevibacillus dissolubilis TaxID=1844116 RepID=UPI0011174423|nr:5-dehydro-4-deoxy-D-glucuronate isomerase [Brevibacillus dissolubilis]